jgi:hypothetical protein
VENEVILYIIRQWAVDNHKSEYIVQEIEKNHEIIAIHKLTPEEIKKTSLYCRGGNWSRGPFLKSGGCPAVFVVAFDDNPQTPNPDYKLSHPFIKNENIFIKENIRSAINSKLPFFLRANPLHSTDDEYESLDVLRRVNYSLFEKVNKAIQKYRSYPSSGISIKIKSK